MDTVLFQILLPITDHLDVFVYVSFGTIRNQYITVYVRAYSSLPSCIQILATSETSGEVSGDTINHNSA